MNLAGAALDPAGVCPIGSGRHRRNSSGDSGSVRYRPFRYRGDNPRLGLARGDRGMSPPARRPPPSKVVSSCTDALDQFRACVNLDGPSVGRPDGRPTPSRRDTYTDGSDPPRRRGGGLTPPLRRAAPAAQTGGSLPSFPSPLARFGSAGLRTTSRTTTAKNGRGGWDTPPAVFGTPPPCVRVRF